MVTNGDPAHALHSSVPANTALLLIAPLPDSYLYSVIPWLCRLVLAQYSAVLLGLPLHLHPEGPLAPSDSDCQLPRPRSPCVADEPALIPSQHPVLHPWAIHPNLARVRGRGHSELEGRSRYMMSTILDTEAVSPHLLWPDVESESAISVVIQLAQLLLAMRPFTLDRQLVLPSSPGVDYALDLFPPWCQLSGPPHCKPPWMHY